jgi:NAD(P)-dependent dehydrogenase (short-subunit alcohol dehydrogenase family)
MDTSALAGKAAIVTGAAQGIGRGIAQALSDRGAQVLLVDRAEAVTAVAAELPKAQALVVDLRDPDAATRIIAALPEARLDILVNNAVALLPAAPFAEHTDEHYELVFDTGPRATFRLMRAAFPLLKANGGSVINLGSSAGTEGEIGFAAYGAAKEAIRGFSKVAALEWGPHNIRVNVVSPFANSEGMRLWEQSDPESYGIAVAKVPMQRIGDTRDDIGATVAFLAGDDATYITGQTIAVDGGRSRFS